MDKDTAFYKKNTLNIEGKLLSLEEPLVMGILNITPDSFYNKSRVSVEKDLLDTAEKMLKDGAAILDIGAYSSRPGAEDIGYKEELERLLPALKSVKKEFPESVISIDTFRAGIAFAAVQEGAAIINDISGGDLDEKMFSTVASLNVPYILMHMRGNPQNMTSLNKYENITLEIIDYFSKKLYILTQCGIKDVIIDPGFGFAKNISQNFRLLKELKSLEILERPLLAGISRKSLIYKTLNIPVEEALTGTIALNMIALQHGANILRVHDVKEAVETVKLFKEIYF